MNEHRLNTQIPIKVLISILTLILLLSGCTIGKQKAFHPLWNLFELPNGYHATSHVYLVNYRGEGANLEICFGPDACKGNFIHPNSANTIKRYHGVDYYENSNAIAWDGQNEEGKWTGGTLYTKTLAWSKGGYTYSVSTSSDISLDELNFFDTKLASEINTKNVNKIHIKKAEMNIATSYFYSTYAKDNGVNMSIVINTPEDGEARMKELTKDVVLDKTEVDGITYFTDKKAFSSNIYAMTKTYSYQFNIGVPFEKQSAETEKEVDFLTVGYVASILNSLD